MAIRTLLLNKQLRDKQRKEAELREKLAAFATREGEIAQAIDEAETDEEQAAVEEAVAEIEASMAETQEALDTIIAEITDIQTQIAASEEAAAAAVEDQEDHPAENDPASRSRKPGTKRNFGGGIMPEDINYRSKSGLFSTRAARDAFYARSDIAQFVADVRSLAANKRSFTGADLLIPVVALEMLRDNMQQYSKLIRYVTVKALKGKARQSVAGDIPEAVWMEAAGALSELDYKVTMIELDGYKVGGFIPIANSYLADSDVNLGEEIMWALGQALGLAIDKAIVYGSGSKMPVGFVTRLAASVQPSWWGSDQGTFTDLHTSNVLTLNIDSNTGTAFFVPLLTALGKAKPNYTNGNAVWIMNHKTKVALLAKCAAYDAGATLLSGMRDTMPIIGGDLVELDFMADNTVAGGYLSAEVLAEREGAVIDSNAGGVFFLNDLTVFRGLARYDGKPSHGEAFVIARWDNQAPATTATFAADYANTDLNVLVLASVAGTASGDTKLSATGVVSASNQLKYIIGGQQKQVAKGQTVDSKWTNFDSGDDVTVATGKTITVVELDAAKRVVSVGNITATAMA